MSEELKLKGTIKQIGEMQTFDSGFCKVELIVETDDKFPQMVKFDCAKVKGEDVIKYNKVGDKVEVSFNVQGSEWKGKYYVNLSAWKVFKVEGETTKPVAEEPIQDDLPF